MMEDPLNHTDEDYDDEDCDDKDCDFKGCSCFGYFLDWQDAYLNGYTSIAQQIIDAQSSEVCCDACEFNDIAYHSQAGNTEHLDNIANGTPYKPISPLARKQFAVWHAMPKFDRPHSYEDITIKKDAP